MTKHQKNPYGAATPTSPHEFACPAGLLRKPGWLTVLCSSYMGAVVPRRASISAHNARRSYFGNLAGSLFIVFLLDETLLFHGAAAPSGLANAMAVSVAKVHSPSGHSL